MKTKTIMLALLLTAAAATQALGQSGTIIGGVEWADANVATPGTFTARPDVGTHCYWWNRTKAWPADGYNLNPTEWKAAGEPNWTANTCPPGWRLPTQAEFESLRNSGWTWANANTKGNAVDGVFLGANHALATINNLQGCIFLPALDVRSKLNGELGNHIFTSFQNNKAIPYDVRGCYWSTTTNGADHTTGFIISPNYVNTVAVDKIAWAQTVRCVQAPTGSGEGTIIGGVKWANTNVAQPGIFAEEPDMHTEFYHWNRAKPWAATGSVDLEEWQDSTEQEWSVNPCPDGGWRLPTADELQALINSGYTMVHYDNNSQNAVKGGFYGANHATATLDDLKGCIYLPRKSYRSSWDGSFFFRNIGGYWSSTQSIALEYGYNLLMGGASNVIADNKRYGFQIRCVRSVDLPYIGNTLWAETNLIAEGTFATRPDTFTNFFQWSRNKDWDATTGGPRMSGWNTTPITATEWTPDPCPDSWRLPTQAELQELVNSGSTWELDYDSRGSEVCGRFFGPRHADCSLPDDMAGCIFLPASGYRTPDRGRLGSQYDLGSYWSSEQSGAAEGHSLHFGEMIAPNVGVATKLSGYNIRCVYDPKAVSTSSQSMSTFGMAQNNHNNTASMFRLPSMTDTTSAAMSSAERAMINQSIAAMPTMTTDSHAHSVVRKAELTAATLYPNPVINGQLTIDNGELEIGKVDVLNSSGAVVRTLDFGSQTTGTLQLHGLQGTYFIRIGKTTQSIVVK